MKKSFIYSMAALLVAGAAFTSCSSSENDIENGQPEQSGIKKYELVVDASKETKEASTRALSWDDDGLKVTWVYGEKVTVWDNLDKIGTLDVMTSGSSTTQLYGSLAPNAPVWLGKELSLKFNYKDDNESDKYDYEHQDGTLSYIQSNCDKAIATVKVIDFNNYPDRCSCSTTYAHFANQQAIVKFKFNKAVSSMTVSVEDDTYNYQVSPASSTKELYVAIRGCKDKNVTITADSYSNTKKLTFENGLYHTVNVNN